MILPMPPCLATHSIQVIYFGAFEITRANLEGSEVPTVILHLLAVGMSENYQFPFIYFLVTHHSGYLAMQHTEIYNVS